MWKKTKEEVLEEVREAFKPSFNSSLPLSSPKFVRILFVTCDIDRGHKALEIFADSLNVTKRPKMTSFDYENMAFQILLSPLRSGDRGIKSSKVIFDGKYIERYLKEFYDNVGREIVREDTITSTSYFCYFSNLDEMNRVDVLWDDDLVEIKEGKRYSTPREWVETNENH